MDRPRSIDELRQRHRARAGGEGHGRVQVESRRELDGGRAEGAQREDDILAPPRDVGADTRLVSGEAHPGRESRARDAQKLLGLDDGLACRFDRQLRQHKLVIADRSMLQRLHPDSLLVVQRRAAAFLRRDEVVVHRARVDDPGDGEPQLQRLEGDVDEVPLRRAYGPVHRLVTERRHERGQEPPARRGEPSVLDQDTRARGLDIQVTRERDLHGGREIDREQLLVHGFDAVRADAQRWRVLHELRRRQSRKRTRGQRIGSRETGGQRQRCSSDDSAQEVLHAHRVPPAALGTTRGTARTRAPGEISAMPTTTTASCAARPDWTSTSIPSSSPSTSARFSATPSATTYTNALPDSCSRAAAGSVKTSGRTSTASRRCMYIPSTSRPSALSRSISARIVRVATSSEFATRLTTPSSGGPTEA